MSPNVDVDIAYKATRHATSKHENKLHTDTKIKADLFNQQFNSVFTPKRTFVSQTPGQNASAGPEISGWPAS